MVQILNRPKTTGERFLEEFAEKAPQIAKGFQTYRQTQFNAKKDLAKSLSNLPGDLAKRLKNIQENAYLTPNHVNELNTRIRPLMEKGFSFDEAFNQVFPDYKKSLNQEDTPSGFGLNNLMGLSGAFSSSLPTREGRASFSERLRGSPEQQSANKLMQEHPGVAAASLGLEPVAAQEDIARLAEPGGLINFAARLLGKGKKPLSEADIAREKLTEGLPEDQKARAQEFGQLGNLIPFERAISALGKLPGKAIEALRGQKAISPSAILPAEQRAMSAAQKRIPFEEPPRLAAQEPIVPQERPTQSPSKSQSVERLPEMQQASMEGRVSAERPPNATEMRVARMTPQSRVFPTEQNIQVREQQLKMFPRYIEEIEADAVKRAAQAEARVPKTVKGMESRKIRQHEAQKALPNALESYDKSIARVRALEDEYAKLSSKQQLELKPLLETAVKELGETNFNLKQAMENLKGVSYRATVDEMRTSARDKMLKIRDTIESGEPYELKKMDYSPDLIREAKRIAKKKPIPYSPKDDFYNQVHEIYANEYRNRLAQLDKEISDLAKTKSMASLARRHELAKERDIINKMIESAEAERAIHKHKFGLRQMKERAKAKERIAQFKKLQESPKIKQEQSVAQQRMWKQRISEAKTPQARNQVISEAVEEIAANDPIHADAIRKEGEKLKEAIEDIYSFKERPAQTPPSGAGTRMEFPKTDSGSGGQKPPSPPPPPKRSAEPGPDKPKGSGIPTNEEILKARDVKKSYAQFKKKIEDAIEKIPIVGNIWKNPFGKDAILGFLTAAWDDWRQEYGLKLTGSQIATLVTSGSRGGIRYIINQAFKEYLFKERRIRKAVEDLKKGRSSQFNRYSKSIQKAARERLS